jgi:2-dehydro-3-deoxygluconokinase
MTTASGAGKSARNLDILCVGETMAMVTPADGLPLRSSEECLLGIGGAESNVACQLAEMGFTAGWASRVGNDPFGSRILDELGRRHVDVSWAAKDPAAPTGVYFKDPDTGQGAGSYYYRSGSAASALDVASAAGWPLENTGWVHLTGILPALSATCAELAEYLLLHGRERPFNVSFDVN